MGSGISEFLTASHRHGDERFAAAAQAAQRGDWPACRQQFETFLDALKHHVKIEEQVLFPAFEQASGIRGGPTWVMRQEHQQMLAMLDEVASAIVARNADDFRASAHSFEALMTAHSSKEEQVLYPMCDQVLTDFSIKKLQELVSQR